MTTNSLYVSQNKIINQIKSNKFEFRGVAYDLKKFSGVGT